MPNQFGKLFDIDGQQVLFYIEPDVEDDEGEDPFRCHQITFKGGIKMDACLEGVERENAERFLSDQNEETAAKIILMLNNLLKGDD